VSQIRFLDLYFLLSDKTSVNSPKEEKNFIYSTNASY
jgi:hypothetical protein